jgi:hypothetical protein
VVGVGGSILPSTEKRKCKGGDAEVLVRRHCNRGGLAAAKTPLQQCGSSTYAGARFKRALDGAT